MGVGFCMVVDEASVDTALAAIEAAVGSAQVIGRVVAGPERRVEVPQRGLVGSDGRFAIGK